MENMLLVCVIMSFVALMISAYAFYQSNEARIEVLAMKKSTHSVQLVPAESMAWDAEEKRINKQIKNSESRFVDEDLDGDEEDESEDK